MLENEKSESAPLAHSESSVRDGDMAPNESTIMVNSEGPPIVLKKVHDDNVVNGEKIRNEFCGLTKEELMKYANDPYWVRLRWFLFILFWVIWLAMLAGAIVVVVFTDKCGSVKSRPWEEDVIYKVDVPNFKDSNNDNVGDLQGVADKLDYFTTLGVNSLLLSPLNKVPSLDHTYNKSGVINSALGNAEDLKSLVQSASQAGIKVILDVGSNQVGLNLSDFVRPLLELGASGLLIHRDDVNTKKSADAAQVLTKLQTLSDEFNTGLVVADGSGGDDTVLNSSLRLVYRTFDGSLSSLRQLVKGVSQLASDSRLVLSINSSAGSSSSNSSSSSGGGEGDSSANATRVSHVLAATLPAIPLFASSAELVQQNTGSGANGSALLWSDSDASGQVTGSPVWQQMALLLHLRRQQPAVVSGNFTRLDSDDGQSGLIAYSRSLPGHQSLLVLVNWSGGKKSPGDTARLVSSLPSQAHIVLRTSHLPSNSTAAVNVTGLQLQRQEAVVLTFKPAV